MVRISKLLVRVVADLDTSDSPKRLESATDLLLSMSFAFLSLKPTMYS